VSANIFCIYSAADTNAKLFAYGFLAHDDQASVNMFYSIVLNPIRAHLSNFPQLGKVPLASGR
jgi:hypothetical protein